MARIGIIAPEFPPRIGGMERLAFGLADALGGSDDVVVYSPARSEPAPSARFRQERAIQGTLNADLRFLASQPVDIWLGLNAGLIPLLARLSQPRFAYLHGNDLLDPWLGYGSWWLEPIRRPYLKSLRHGIRRRSLRAAARTICHFFTNSRSTAEIAQKRLGLEVHRLTICPPGVEDAFFSVARTPRSGPLRLITVARMTEHSRRKNIDGVLRALGSIRRELDFFYTLVGDGDDRRRLEAVAAHCGISARVRFAGELDDEGLRRCYGEADLFVLASQASETDVEGFGIVYIEANAAGVPVLASRSGGAIDAVEEGVSGLLVPDSSPESIAKGIVRFEREHGRYREANVRAWAAKHRWPAIASRLRSKLFDDSQ